MNTGGSVLQAKQCRQGKAQAQPDVCCCRHQPQEPGHCCGPSCSPEPCPASPHHRGQRMDADQLHAVPASVVVTGLDTRSAPSCRCR